MALKKVKTKKATKAWYPVLLHKKGGMYLVFRTEKITIKIQQHGI